ncbi:kinase-like protein [Basidiobolus meristosporus CBS 931.73]|uniref:Kinase-like protein n=1 Tax=Basidiobolus meristosporus CBS 931.73 TaxID=1314790 RepID=A0A1Y1YP25_9FUNG|nr:kinase-like protein [Basidiobolus meristosporus CBS 931.73]|eukprot:ORX99761.1 kinase-like protein [Basidiobolus meristosporus CBS 931.73]
MPTAKYAASPYITSQKDLANKGINIPYHSCECDTTSSATSSTSSLDSNSGTLYSIPSRFIVPTCKSKKPHHEHKHHFGLFRKSKSEKKHKDSYLPLLEALKKRNAPSIHKLYGDSSHHVSSGAGGSVHVTRCPCSGKRYAIKSFRKKAAGENAQSYYQWISNEIYIAISLSHPNIVQTVDVVLEDKQVHQVMEYCPRDLFTLAREDSLTQQQIDRYFMQLMNGLSYLHQRGVAHRDLKLENLCIDEKDNLKIIDFGCAFILLDPFAVNSKAYASSIVGSDPYIAPEIFCGGVYDAAKADVWSAAIIYLCMILRKFPWDIARTSDKSYGKFLKHRHSDKYFRKIPTDALSILRRMLDPNPDTRATVEDVLYDPWFQSLTSSYAACE